MFYIYLEALHQLSRIEIWDGAGQAPTLCNDFCQGQIQGDMIKDMEQWRFYKGEKLLSKKPLH